MGVFLSGFIHSTYQPTGVGDSPTFVGLTLSGLTASKPVGTDANKALTSLSTTGSGNVVLATSPSLTTPTLGVATATSINKLTLTQPATSATLTIIDGQTLTAELTSVVNQDLTTDASPTFAGLTVSGLTASYVPKAGVGGLLGDSLLYDDGTYVAIGTATPDVDWGGGRLVQVTATSSFGVVSVGSNNRVADAERIGAITFDALGNTDSYRTRALIEMYLSGSTANKLGGILAFFTAANNATNPTERMRIDRDGNIGFNLTAWGTSAAKVWGVGSGTAPTTSPADAIQGWVADFLGSAGDARLHIMAEGSADGRTILGSGKVTHQGTTGGYTKQFAEATATLSGASTTIQTNVPSGSRILGVQLRVDTLITSGDGGTTWTAAFVNVPTTAITSGQAFAQNTKFSKATADEIATGEVDITITPNAGTFSAGVIRAIIYYEIYDAMADAA